MEHKRNHIVMTGGTSGVGKELVRLLAPSNQLTVVGRVSERSEALLAEFPHIRFVEADLAERGSRQAVREAVPPGPLHGLINCAAIQCLPHFTDPDFDFQTIRRETELNFMAPAELIALFLPDLTQATDPFILNVNSGLAIVPKPDSAVYCANKAALDSLTQSLRAQLAQTAVKLHQAFLPMVDTPMTKGRSGKKLAADRVAREILSGMAAGQPDIDIGKVGLLRIINRWAPGLARSIIRKASG